MLLGCFFTNMSYSATTSLSLIWTPLMALNGHAYRSKSSQPPLTMQLVASGVALEDEETYGHVSHLMSRKMWCFVNCVVQLSPVKTQKKKTLFQYNKINMHIFSNPNNTNFLRSHTPIKWQTSQNYLESSLASCTWMRILHMSSSSWGFSYASITETAWMNTFPAKLKRLNLFQLLANLIIV